MCRAIGCTFFGVTTSGHAIRGTAAPLSTKRNQPITEGQLTLLVTSVIVADEMGQIVATDDGGFKLCFSETPPLEVMPINIVQENVLALTPLVFLYVT